MRTDAVGCWLPASWDLCFQAFSLPVVWHRDWWRHLSKNSRLMHQITPCLLVWSWLGQFSPCISAVSRSRGNFEAFCIQHQAWRDTDDQLEQGIKDGLGRHIEAIAMTDPSLAGPTRIMQVSNNHLLWIVQLVYDYMPGPDSHWLSYPRLPWVYQSVSSSSLSQAISGWRFPSSRKHCRSYSHSSVHRLVFYCHLQMPSSKCFLGLHPLSYSKLHEFRTPYDCRPGSQHRDWSGDFVSAADHDLEITNGSQIENCCGIHTLAWWIVRPRQLEFFTIECIC